MEVFRINELLRRNTKTKGLQGKDLKTFHSLVDEFKQAVLEDIVLVKKDNAEVRMRRAGYLRYTSKTAYGIVEERYTAKDWKTGEKIASSSSDLSGSVTPADETGLSRYVGSTLVSSQTECATRFRANSSHDSVGSKVKTLLVNKTRASHRSGWRLLTAPTEGILRVPTSA